MSSFWQRMLTVVAAVGTGALGVFVPATAPFAIPAATLLLGWATKHPADAPKEPPQP